jgi:hypothetical protein
MKKFLLSKISGIEIRCGDLHIPAMFFLQELFNFTKVLLMFRFLELLGIFHMPMFFPVGIIQKLGLELVIPLYRRYPSSAMPARDTSPLSCWSGGPPIFMEERSL